MLSCSILYVKSSTNWLNFFKREGTYTCMAQNKMKQTSRRNVEIQVLSMFKSLLIHRYKHFFPSMFSNYYYFCCCGRCHCFFFILLKCIELDFQSYCFYLIWFIMIMYVNLIKHIFILILLLLCLFAHCSWSTTKNYAHPVDDEHAERGNACGNHVSDSGRWSSDDISVWTKCQTNYWNRVVYLVLPYHIIS